MERNSSPFAISVCSRDVAVSAQVMFGLYLVAWINFHRHYMCGDPRQCNCRESPSGACFQNAAPAKPPCHFGRKAPIDTHCESAFRRKIVQAELCASCGSVHPSGFLAQLCLDTPNAAHGRRYIFVCVHMTSAFDIQSSVQLMFPFLFGRHLFCNHGTPSEVFASLPQNPVRFLVARGLSSGHFRVRPRVPEEDCFRPGAIYHNSTRNLRGSRSAPASRDSSMASTQRV